MSTQPGSKKKRFLAPQEKYAIWMQLVRGETTIAKLREVARQGALDGLARSRPGRRERQRDLELEAAEVEVGRLRTALAELAVRLTLVEGKEPWG